MKKLFTLLAMLTCVVVSYAQNNLVATLNHGETVSIYYGAKALQEAHAAAAHGDVITLSSGSFDAVNITKAITLRGAGMQTRLDSINSVSPTALLGDFCIQIADSTTEKLAIEGIAHNKTITIKGTMDGAQFIKSRLQNVVLDNTAKLLNGCILHCKIIEKLDLTKESNCSFIGSYIYRCISDGATLQFMNCIVKTYGWYSQGNRDFTATLSTFSSSSFFNCVLIGFNQLYESQEASRENNKLPASAYAYNCVAMNTFQDINCFTNISNSTNRSSTYDVVFAYFKGTYSDDITFALTDSAKTTFLGTDGTQVGIYGGSFPFDPTVSVPQITKFEVAKQSTADGKLNVNIEVNAAAEEPKK